MFDIRNTALPLRPEERDTPDRDIYNRPTYRNTLAEWIAAGYTESDYNQAKADRAELLNWR